MSLYGRDFLRQAHNLLRVDENDDEVDVQFQEHGYLFLSSTNAGKDQLLANHQVQQSVGCTDIHLLEPIELQHKFPWLNTSDILLGSFGTRGEGWFDPWALILGLKRKCQSMGVNFVKGYPVASEQVDTQGSSRVVSVDVLEEKGRVVRYHVNHVVNTAGAHCNDVMEILGGGRHRLLHPIPVEPRKRCIFFIHCNTQQQEYVVPHVAPLTICPLTGVYFRSEGLIRSDGVPTGNFLCGVSPSRDVDRAIGDMDELEYADHELWDDIIWPALAHRVPAFGEVKVKSSWAGLYEYNTIDQNAIIGFHPEVDNVVLANGFSGHGLQQSPAAGRAVAELLSCDGQFESLDLRVFSFDRLVEKRPLFEAGIV
jgi:FAD-dependent oxidoreductase domain-containing protein 1